MKQLIGPDDKSILLNQGSTRESFSPGDEHTSQISDALYHGTAGTSSQIGTAKSSVRYAGQSKKGFLNSQNWAKERLPMLLKN